MTCCHYLTRTWPADTGREAQTLYPDNAIRAYLPAVPRYHSAETQVVRRMRMERSMMASPTQQQPSSSSSPRSGDSRRPPRPPCTAQPPERVISSPRRAPHCPRCYPGPRFCHVLICESGHRHAGIGDLAYAGMHQRLFSILFFDAVISAINALCLPTYSPSTTSSTVPAPRLRSRR